VVDERFNDGAVWVEHVSSAPVTLV
jgi:hypothetical protein